MKTAFAVFAQFLLFMVVFLGVSLVGPFHLRWFVTHPTLTSTRYFVPDGLILMVLLYAIILVVEGARKRLATGAVWTTAAFALALISGLLAKFGFVTHDLF